MHTNSPYKSPYREKKKRPAFFFHNHDYDLLDMVNHMLHSDLSEADARRKFFHHLHPRGIKEMSEIKGLRIAYAMVHLLGQIDGKNGATSATNRINALKALFDEVMCSTEPVLRINTGRVLAAIMKELIRSRDPQRQLQLAHDFQRVVSGRPRVIRSYLKEYNLLEMPEEWNQIVFDDHVHDANTKGRKSATHLIMDAWIKGIRRLRIVYYNFIARETARELIAAGQILGMHVRIGIQFSAAFHGRFVHLIWEPRGFGSALNFLNFFSRQPVLDFMAKGKMVSEYEKGQVLHILDQFNKNHLPAINEKFHISMPEINSKEFLAFVGIGQASRLHLAKFIHTKLLPLMEESLSGMAKIYPTENKKAQAEINALLTEMNQCGMDYILHHFLTDNAEQKQPKAMEAEILPELMTLSPAMLIDRLEALHSGFKIILSLSRLNAADVLELIHDCKGRIHRLEVFSLKNYVNDNTSHIPEIIELQQAINSGNIIKLKQITLGMMKKLTQNANTNGGEENPLMDLPPEIQKRLEKFRRILGNMDAIKKMYEIHSLGPRIGSNSTEHSLQMYGMGIAITDALPARAQKQIRKNQFPCSRLPLNMDMNLRINYDYLKRNKGLWSVLLAFTRKIPFFHLAGLSRTKEWIPDINSMKMSDSGNIITLGQVCKNISNGLCLGDQEDDSDTKKNNLRSWKNLNSGWENFFKIFIGFLPAFFTFFLTREFWVLRYFGACIWFGITGLRNICQSVMGGGGMRRSSLLKWNDFVNWRRLSDSLMYTGFSVPLLDLLVKQLILCKGLSITVASHPLILFSTMAIANGIYLSSHNVFRGLPREAAIGNFFRSVLSIPVAFGMNAFLFWFLTALGMDGVNMFLQSWAAVISKLASDCVAGFIEGNADRTVNIGNRILDYKQKLMQFQEIYARLEIRFPEQEIYTLLDHPRQWFASADETTRDMIAVLIIHSLDMLYFWMYQPRARTAFTNILKAMPREERQILLKAQNVLTMNHEISQLFLDGIAGYNFSKPLAFYLARYEEYLATLHKKEGTEPAVKNPFS